MKRESTPPKWDKLVGDWDDIKQTMLDIITLLNFISYIDGLDEEDYTA
jgi:hypothetical protein